MKKTTPFYIFIVIFWAFLELIVIEISSLLIFLADHKKKGDLSIDLIKEKAIDIFQHPISTISQLISENNPLFYIGSLALIIYMLFVVFKTPKDKQDWEAETKNQTHGSARYAEDREIFIPGRIEKISHKQMLQQFKESLKKGNG
ncbi:hypothetical protein P8832_09665 [Bacillus subtilis]|uniref:hypothetical protein n=1 Tax=Bacillus subtilis TaxID=1423 RepID=UPI002DB571B4|nr:hypothetical protein [Bacillus subtilis]MEC0434427.1 hypothetical protein [Bacillus subtilis]